MKIGDTIRADKIEGGQEFVKSREDKGWLLYVYGIAGFAYYIFVGHHNSSPMAIYGLHENHYQAPARLLYQWDDEEQTKCGREACNNVAHPKLRNSSTKRVYCVECARKIDESAVPTLGRSLFDWTVLTETCT